MKSELISGSHLTPGSRFLMTFEQDGQQFEFIEELIDIKENEKFIFNMETELFRGESKSTLKETNEKQRSQPIPLWKEPTCFINL